MHGVKLVCRVSLSDASASIVVDLSGKDMHKGGCTCN